MINIYIYDHSNNQDIQTDGDDSSISHVSINNCSQCENNNECPFFNEKIEELETTVMELQKQVKELGNT